MKNLLTLLMIGVCGSAAYAQQITYPEAQTYYSRALAESVYSSDAIVKGAPFSGESTNETIQTLGDGNRIIRRSTSRLFRDSEGRYRREDMPKQLGLPGAVIDMPESIVILDPVAGFRYSLDTKNNTARKTPFGGQLFRAFAPFAEYKLKAELDRAKVYSLQGDTRATGEVAQVAPASAAKLVELAKIDAEGAKTLALRKEELEKVLQQSVSGVYTIGSASAVDSKYETKSESLGEQNIEGVQADGTRTITTIPAGAIGNERPIEVIYERWYSKDLKMIVMSKHSDPRVGEQTYKITNIRRNEPDSSLFSPPADYKVIDGYKIAPKAIVVTKPTSAIRVAVPVKPVVSTISTKPASAPAAPKPQ